MAPAWWTWTRFERYVGIPPQGGRNKLPKEHSYTVGCFWVLPTALETAKVPVNSLWILGRDSSGDGGFGQPAGGFGQTLLRWLRLAEAEWLGTGFGSPVDQLFSCWFSFFYKTYQTWFAFFLPKKTASTFIRARSWQTWPRATLDSWDEKTWRLLASVSGLLWGEEDTPRLVSWEDFKQMMLMSWWPSSGSCFPFLWAAFFSCSPNVIGLGECQDMALDPKIECWSFVD